MKRIDFYYFLTIALIALMVYIQAPSASQERSIHHHSTPISRMSKEQLGSHEIQFKDMDSPMDTLATCSSTAIAPHAFMTATHCLLSAKTSLFTMDYALEFHQILAVETDGRDHVIVLTDGTPFKNYSPIIPATPSLNEVVTIFGDGGYEYPPVPKYGRVTDCQDPSDVDEAAGVQCWTIPVIAGDSGSAVYNSKGQVVSLISYGLYEGKGKPTTGIGFTLNFTQKQWDHARTFDGLPVPEPPAKKPAAKK